MSVSEMRRQRKAKAAERLAAEMVQAAVERVVAARPCRKCRARPLSDGTVTHRISCTDYAKGNIEPIARIVPREQDIPSIRAAAHAVADWVQHGEETKAADDTLPPSSPQDLGAEVKRLRDVEEMSWWVIGQKLGLAEAASSASEPEAKRGAGKARSLYAAANRGTVPRSHAPRKGTTPKPQGPASRGVPAYVRKTQLVNEGHVIPRDMPDEEVAALLCGRGIKWAIDMARLTDTDPATWGPDDHRWITLDAKVHVDPQWVYVSMDEDTGQRTVRFREYAGFDTDRGKHMSGPTRVVRVDSIFEVV